MKRINNDFEYEQVMNEIETLTDCASGGGEIKRLKMLRDLVEEYEEELYFSSGGEED